MSPRRTKASRQQSAADRDARRESLAVILSRIQRGVPITPAEGALLRAHVELEITESNELRRTLGGQQAASRRMARRVEAAEAAIREAEQRAEAAEERARTLEKDARDNGADARAEYQRAKTAEQQLAAARAALDNVRHARTWAEVWSALGMHYGMTAIQAGQEARARRPVAEQRAEDRAEQAEAVAAEAKRLLERRTTTLRTRAEYAEQQLADTREKRNRWAAEADTQILAAHRRADRYHAAWRNARARALKAQQQAAALSQVYATGAQLGAAVRAMAEGVAPAVQSFSAQLRQALDQAHAEQAAADRQHEHQEQRR
ncbi:hypothetical protein [Streptomyces sp. enrichment culture]|uniref:hypothetical protein n=1 Tax=Streptomyces sp. enrichment culture TaxID=1795815 RepID=UPI003F572F35